LWRDHVFVIAIDAGVVTHDNFNNVLQDIAVLWNLHIKVVLVYGLGHSLFDTARARGVAITDHRGEGPTDEKTLKLAIEVAGTIGHEIMEGLTQNGIKCVQTNAVRATEMGVIGGIDQLRRGKVEKIDLALLRQLLANEIIPIISPVAFSRDGQSLRLNSDQLGSDLAIARGASKLIYMAPHPGLVFGDEVVLNYTVEELRQAMQRMPDALDPDIRGKAVFAIKTIEGGTPRVHIIDGREPDTLLTEIFNNVGVGSMIYGNEYAQIRPARRRDAQAIHLITQQAQRNEALKKRTRQEIIQEINHFYVYEIDNSIIGCVSLKPWGEDSVEVVEFCLREAARTGKTRVLALTTQSYGFFKNAAGFDDGTREDLPPERLRELEKSGRNSKILIKRL